VEHVRASLGGVLLPIIVDLPVDAGPLQALLGTPTDDRLMDTRKFMVLAVVNGVGHSAGGSV